MLKWRKYHYEINVFSNTHWPQLTAPFYSILFETSICQFNSSKCSPITPDEVREHLTRDQRHSFIQNHSRPFRFTDPWRCFFSSSHSSSTGVRSENTWREIRDHSFIQNHSRSFRFTDPWRCFFSSSHSCSTGVRSENTWREIRDHSFIQNHSRPFRFTDPWRCFFSSSHSCSTGFRSEDWDGQQKLGVVFSDPFMLFLRFVFGLLSGWKIQTWPIIRFLTEWVTYWFFLSVGIW